MGNQRNHYLAVLSIKAFTMLAFLKWTRVEISILVAHKLKCLFCFLKATFAYYCEWQLTQRGLVILAV